MPTHLTRALLVMTCLNVFAYAQCANDHRSDKHGGIAVVDFAVTGTTSLGSAELGQLAGGFIGSCYNDDSEEMQERLRAEFQNRGYFMVEVKSLSLKSGDPLGIPKLVTVEAEVAEGPRYKVGEITFLGNHALSAERLREAFTLKKGDVFARDKIARGLESLRSLYGSDGFVDFSCIPDTEPSSDGTMILKVTITEGPQYHMGKLEIVASNERAARLRAEWKMSEGSTYDSTYITKFVEGHHGMLPEGLTPEDVRHVSNCPKAIVDVSLTLDPREGKSDLPEKSIPCESHHGQSK